MKGAKKLAESNTAFIQRVRFAHAKLSSDKHELEHDDIDACPLWYDGCNCVKAILSWLPGLTERLEHADNRLAAIDSAVTGELGEIQERYEGRIFAGGGYQQVTKDVGTLLAIVQRQAGELYAARAMEAQAEKDGDEARAEVERLKAQLAEHADHPHLYICPQVAKSAADMGKERDTLKAANTALASENARLVNEHAAAMKRADVLAEGVRRYRLGILQAVDEWEFLNGHMVSK